MTTVVVTTNTGTSICWNCKNGRADRCKWISQKKQVWERAYKRVCTLERERGQYAIWTVQECEHYIPENPRWNPRRRQKKKAAIVARPYTPEDDALIQELRGKGVPCTVIADRMGRSRSSIYRRIARLKEENHTWAKELVGVE